MPSSRTSRRGRTSALSIVRPTCRGFRVESAHDIFLLLEACQQLSEQFPILSRRISGEEYRPLISHGSVFVFEQQPQLERWTDCRRWMENKQVGLWLVYPEAVKVPKTNTYGQHVNLHPDNEKRYLRSNLIAQINGLRKHTVTVSVAPVDEFGPRRKLSIIAFIDPAREHELAPIERHPDLATIHAAYEESLVKYRFEEEVSESAQAGPTRRSRARRRQCPRAKTYRPTISTPSMSPVPALSDSSSMSPVTPFHSLPPSEHPISAWASGSFYHPASHLCLRPGPIQLAPLRWPPNDEESSRKTALPPLHQVVGDLMKVGDRQLHMSIGWDRWMS
ncbi:hypothetical protein CALCODRAFT_495962 [Calocera cornea HHB12733]|uniref:Uncharacterized protein n=1 Tax=Calocera cornea HHB12733 TaxID=1353952 RepID=A0A165G403_9BASI|nr:hypothetical protein CALCODRAFT_495962 [Calocera cornea HHB12733]